MLNIKYILGAIDGTAELDPTQLTGDVNTDLQSPYLQGLISGRVAAIKNGYVQLAQDGDLDIGLIVHDAVSAYGTNQASVATGKLALLIGGAVVDTDQVIETDIVAGDPLYIGTDGQLTKNAPDASSKPVAVSRSSNNATDKTITIHFF